MVDQIARLPLTRENLAWVVDPTATHRHAMGYLPNLAGRSAAIRNDTGTQFRVDLPSDPLGVPGKITLRFRGEALTCDLEQVEVNPILDDTPIIVRVAAERRKTIEKHVYQRTVTDADAADWGIALLDRHGLTVTGELAVSPVHRFGHPHTHGEAAVSFATRDVLATVAVRDPALAEAATRHGIGRGRAYGLGMIVTVPNFAR